MKRKKKVQFVKYFNNGIHTKLLAFTSNIQPKSSVVIWLYKEIIETNTCKAVSSNDTSNLKSVALIFCPIVVIQTDPYRSQHFKI